MGPLSIINKKNVISYYIHISNKKKAPYVIFLHGLMSNKDGVKAIHIENYCKVKGYNFIRFDNFGHGESSGAFVDQTITSWNQGVSMVVDQLVPDDNKILFIGSSAGGQNAFLVAQKYHTQTIGMIGLAAAFDFTEELIWKKLSQNQKNQLEHDKKIMIKGDHPDCDDAAYPINYNLILDGRKYLVDNFSNEKLGFPIILIHGMQDYQVPYEHIMKILSQIKSDNIILKLIKDGAHKLSRKQDLEIIENSIDEIIYTSGIFNDN